MSNKLFSEVLNGKKSESSFNGLQVDELKALKNAAASIISRASDLEKRDKAAYLRSLIQAELDKQQPVEVKAEWKTKDTSELTLEDVNKALKQAQWYKHHYGPKEQAKWKKVKSSVAKTDPLYTKAIKFLDKAEDEYQKALSDEAHWQDIKDNMDTNKPVSKKEDQQLQALKEVVVDLESKKTLTRKEQDIIERLRSILK